LRESESRKSPKVRKTERPKDNYESRKLEIKPKIIRTDCLSDFRTFRLSDSLRIDAFQQIIQVFSMFAIFVAKDWKFLVGNLSIFVREDGKSGDRKSERKENLLETV
jgi:hypothetical protein